MTPILGLLDRLRRPAIPEHDRQCPNQPYQGEVAAHQDFLDAHAVAIGLVGVFQRIRQTTAFNSRDIGRVCDLSSRDLIASYQGQPERGYDALCALLLWRGAGIGGRRVPVALKKSPTRG